MSNGCKGHEAALAQCYLSDCFLRVGFYSELIQEQSSRADTRTAIIYFGLRHEAAVQIVLQEGGIRLEASIKIDVLVHVMLDRRHLTHISCQSSH